MEFPDVRTDNISLYLNSADIVQETVDQIMKDFGLFGVKIVFSGNIPDAYNELHHQLVKQVTRLLDKDYRKLLSVLYQVDITDKEIQKAEQELPQYDHVEVLAHQIIVRDLKKVLTRYYFKSQK